MMADANINETLLKALANADIDELVNCGNRSVQDMVILLNKAKQEVQQLW